jgi:superfamily II DNA or RNA helicase
MTERTQKATLLDIPAIDKRLVEIESEREALLQLKQQLSYQPQSDNSEQLSLDQKIAIFKNLFRGRSDIYAIRWQNKQGRSGYSVACDNEWIQGKCRKPKIKCQECNHRKFKALTDQEVYRHLSGQQVVGLYPLSQNNTCYLLAADFDKTGWQDAVKAMSEACTQYNVPHALEISRSGNGAHLWIFFDTPIQAREARLLGFCLLDKAMEIYPNLSFDSYDRLFPNQDILPEGGFGNLIALPLQKKARLSGNSSFVDCKLCPYSDQFGFLLKLKTISVPELNDLLVKISPDSIRFKEQEVADNRPPWERTAKINPLVLENPPEKITITLANHVYFKLDGLPTPLIARLRRLASFSNPVFFKTQALRFSTHGIPRFISCARVEQGYLSLPRGCLDEALDLISEQSIAVEIDDKRETGTRLSKLKLGVSLRKAQQTAVMAITKHDNGVLHAPTAFGKTVTAIGIIAKRKTNTLILTHSRLLLEQWKERLEIFLPEASIGIWGGGKKKTSGQIDVATYQSLISKKDNTLNSIVQDYGQVIVDECHHVSAPRFEMVLNEVRAKYVLGLTATPERQDGHQKIVFMAVGPVRHKVKSTTKEKFEQEVVVTQFYDEPPIQLSNSKGRPKISDVYRWLIENRKRTQHIVKDVLLAISESKHPLVLTERREHADEINQLLIENGIDAIILKGGMKATERKLVKEKLPTTQAVVATGKYVGEGFDLPRLDTLFLAMPIAWKGSLAQYAGRIHRESAGKTKVKIYDYVDSSLPMLQRMFNKREKSYKAMGYSQFGRSN